MRRSWPADFAGLSALNSQLSTGRGALTPALDVQSADAFATIYAYLRRTYYVATAGTWDAAKLTALATQVFTCATKEVVITGTCSEVGGAASGQVKFDKMVYLQAIEALLAEECADSLPPADPCGTITNFGCRPLSL